MLSVFYIVDVYSSFAATADCETPSIATAAAPSRPA
jgi:hypothetical protein